MNRRIYIFIFILLWITNSYAQQHKANISLVLAEKTAINHLKVHDGNKQLPVFGLQDLNMICVNFGFKYNSVFDSLVNKYTKVDTLSKIYDSNNISSLNDLNDRLKLYNYVILKTDGNLSKLLISFIKEIEKNKKVIIVQKGYSGGISTDFKSSVIATDLNDELSAACAAKEIFGGIAVNGKAVRLNYTVPESVGMNADKLDTIAAIMKDAIDAKGTPGAVVLIVKNGNVIYHKAFGSHKYDRVRTTKADDIYDMASITKLAATTNTTMKLVDDGKLSVDSVVTKYIARTRGMPEKKDLKIKEILLHQAGFFPYIKFYEYLKPKDTDTLYSKEYPTQLADGYFLRKNYFEDTMWPAMLNDQLLTRGKYVYSDLSMYYMKEVVEKVSLTPLNVFAADHFYKPLGMQRAGFLPRQRFEKDNIVPTTENDGWLRSMPVQGFVNDPGAAMLGGVSGHAGFFASANDMAILGQMWLNKGSYGGWNYIKAETLERFTSSQSQVSRRGYGFDRKDSDPAKGYPSTLASNEVFGHTGYTGTAIWVDPKHDLVYVFLSNRVYPDDKNKALNTLNTRSKIMDVIYRAMH
ncbi:hypothetical protein AB669_02385 [Pedobacter sp. BMA]|nr:hypothetical protein AB669_02385 [Pedobacter sp. BMA]